MGRSTQFISFYIFKGREAVKNVITDLSSGFRSFVKSFFPNATITADKFHVLRLLSGPIQEYKREVIGKQRKNPFMMMLQKEGSRLKAHEKNTKKLAPRDPNLL